MIINVFKKYQMFLDFNISFRKIAIRKGICSKNYDNDKHMLLWDFDEVELWIIKFDLRYLQEKYKLPPVYIFESSENHYHAYCFVMRDLKEVIHILSDTATIDMDYLKLGVARGYYTLRFTPKGDKNVKLIHILKSSINNEMSPMDITINEYYTTNI